MTCCADAGLASAERNNTAKAPSRIVGFIIAVSLVLVRDFKGGRSQEFLLCGTIPPVPPSLIPLERRDARSLFDELAWLDLAADWMKLAAVFEREMT
jgi:hypothetical protein